MTVKRRFAFVATLAAVVGWAAAGLLANAQTPKAGDKPAKGWNEPDTHPTLFPDIERDKDYCVQWAVKKSSEVVVYETDPPAIRAAKRMLVARVRQLELVTQIVPVGALGGARWRYGMSPAVEGVAESAALVWDRPEQLLPWYEWRLSTLKGGERLLAERVKQELETEPDRYSQVVAERYKAEIDLLKVREKAKK